MIAEWLAGPRVDKAVALCARHDIPAGMVHDLAQAMGSEQAKARRLETAVPHPVFGSIGIVPQPARLASGGTVAASREPMVGEQGAQVLRELLGRSDDEITALRVQGVMV